MVNWYHLPFNNLIPDDGPVRQGNRTVDCGLDGLVRQGNFRYALDRYRGFVALFSMRAAIAAASLYDAADPRYGKPVWTKANGKTRLNAAYQRICAPQINC